MKSKAMKFGLIFFIISLAIFTTNVLYNKYALSSDQTHDMADLVSKAFTSTGAKQTGYSVHDWSVIDEQYHTKQDLQALGERLNKTLQIHNPVTYESANGSQNVYQIRGNWDSKTSISMMLTSMLFPGKNPQTTLVIRAESSAQGLRELPTYIDQIKKTIALTNARPQISTCIQGFLSDRMNTVERNQLISKTLSSVNANELEGVRSDLVASISGYSPMSQDFITTNGKKMNLQVAIHYDSYRHQTQVLVGSPIVTIEY
jgi:TATA-box binding